MKFYGETPSGGQGCYFCSGGVDSFSAGRFESDHNRSIDFSRLFIGVHIFDLVYNGWNKAVMLH